MRQPHQSGVCDATDCRLKAGDSDVHFLDGAEFADSPRIPMPESSHEGEIAQRSVASWTVLRVFLRGFGGWPAGGRYYKETGTRTLTK